MVALGQFSWDLSLNVLPPHFLSHTMLGSKKMIIDKRDHDFERAGTEQVISMQHIKDYMVPIIFQGTVVNGVDGRIG
jgi:hypothetical protein